MILMGKQAQKRIYAINVAAMQEMEAWTKQLTALWEQRFDALEKVIEEEKQKLA